MKVTNSNLANSVQRFFTQNKVCKLQLFVIYHVYGTYNFIVRKKIAFKENAFGYFKTELITHCIWYILGQEGEPVLTYNAEIYWLV